MTDRVTPYLEIAYASIHIKHTNISTIVVDWLLPKLSAYHDGPILRGGVILRM